MPISPYVQELRTHVGHSLLLLPGVTALIERDEQILLAKQRDTSRWSLVGGGIEPGEEPADAIRREVYEELGACPHVGPIVGAYGGSDLVATLPNGDEVGYVTVAYRCSLPDQPLKLEQEELLEVQWFNRAEIIHLERHAWIDRVLSDLDRT